MSGSNFKQKFALSIALAAIGLALLGVYQAAASTTYDMLTWFRNPNWKTSHLEGKNQSGVTVKQYVFDTGQNIVYTKSQQGWPWDVKSYDSNWIYDWITEMDWTSPSDYKANSPKMQMVPRYWNGDNSWSHADGSIPVLFYQNCAKVKTGANSPVFTMTGPYAYNFGGNVGTLNTIRVNYQWSPIDLEQLYLTQEHGWVLWTYLRRTSTSSPWNLVQWSNHNQVVQGSLTPVFKCFRIP